MQWSSAAAAAAAAAVAAAAGVLVLTGMLSDRILIGGYYEYHWDHYSYIAIIGYHILPMLIIHCIFTRNIIVCVHSHCLRNKKPMFLLEATLAPTKRLQLQGKFWPTLPSEKNSAALDCQGALALASSVLSQRCSSQSETPTQDLHDRKQTGKNDRRILNGGSFCFTASPPNGLHVVGACTPRKRRSKSMLKKNNAMNAMKIVYVYIYSQQHQAWTTRPLRWK